jgi:hypothetical protein
MLVRASTQDFAGTHRIMDIGCVDLNMQQIAHYVDNHMALTTFHFFAAIDTAFSGGPGFLDRIFPLYKWVSAV